MTIQVRRRKANVMSPRTTRNCVFVLGALLCLGSFVFAAACSLIYVSRYTYVRPVYSAKDSGQDPYELAREGVGAMAGHFVQWGAAFAIAVFVLGIVMVAGTLRRRL